MKCEVLKLAWEKVDLSLSGGQPPEMRWAAYRSRVTESYAEWLGPVDEDTITLQAACLSEAGDIYRRQAIMDGLNSIGSGDIPAAKTCL